MDILDVENAEAMEGADLDAVAPWCDKRPWHRDFINIDEFTIDHLPPEIRHYTMYVWLRNCAPLVVRLIRNTKATGRACFIAGESSKTYICRDIHCPYLESLGECHELHGGIGIITNGHVVMNDSQAAITNVEFFYNSNDSRREMVVKEVGTKMYMTNKQLDYTVFTCHVHSRELVDLVTTFDRRRNCSWLAIPRHIRDTSRNFAIVISHPHGASKKISIGNVIDHTTQSMSSQEAEVWQLWLNLYNICAGRGPRRIIRFDAYLRQFPDVNLRRSVTWYTAPTCKGSSGAPVYMGNTVLEYGEEINQAHTHRGVDSDRGLNICST